MNTALELTQEKLKELLHYDKDTGIFKWKKIGRGRNKKNIPGTVTIYGYRTICIGFKGKSNFIRAHRLAWFYEYGELPKKHLDHINHDRLDNRICNLREVDRIDNQRNQKMYSTNKSGFTGVCWHDKVKKWQAQIKVAKKTINLGLFENKDDAIMARLHANRLYKFHANHGKDLKQKESK